MDANTHMREEEGEEGEEEKRRREVAQQVVHTARWVPGAWRGWLRYQTAHTRGGGQNISSEHRNQEKGRTEEESGISRRTSRAIICVLFLSAEKPEANRVSTLPVTACVRPTSPHEAQ